MSLDVNTIPAPPALDFEAAADPTARVLEVVPPLAPATDWRALLPSLEAELGDDLRRFRKRMLAGKVPADYVNRDLIGSRRSGAWAVLRVVRDSTEFTLYVRRFADQLAVNENGGHPYVVTSNFSSTFAGPAPTSEELREGFDAALRRHGLLVVTKNERRRFSRVDMTAGRD